MDSSKSNNDRSMGHWYVGKDGKVSTTKFSARQVTEALWECKGMVSFAAKRLGCTPQTIRKYAERFSQVALAIADAREEVVDTAELSLRQAVMNGEPWAVTMTLKTLGAKRGYVERREEHTTHAVVTGTVQEWEQRLQAAHTALEEKRAKAIEADFKELPHAHNPAAS